MDNSQKGMVKLGMPHDQKPTESELNRFLTKYCTLWRPIGLKLKLKSSVLDMIKGSHQTDQRECLRVTLWKWLQLDRDNATWQTLELAITNANREELDLPPLGSDGQPVTSQLEATSETDSVFDRIPEMGDLNVIVVPRIMAYWEDVAFALRYKIPTVTGIRETCHTDPKKCCQELFKDWISTENGVSPKTWSTLLNKLKQVQELFSVTKEIRREVAKL
ncbi:uncharacterized protein [Dysidea avara]|uniref:uncharacterized protein n=1 Tax=Dysidea avara TaxID=196820 RepID=UPI00331FAA59